MTTPRLPHDDLTAALAARRELGPDYDAAFVESVVDRVEQTLDSRMGVHLRNRTDAEREDAKGERAARIAIACVTLGVAIPLTAIAAAYGGLAGLLVAWGGLVLINLAYALGSRRR